MSKSTNFKNTVEWFSNPKIAISLAIMVLLAAGLVWLFWDKIRDAINAAKLKKQLKEKEQENQSLFGDTTAGIDFTSLATQIYRAMKGGGTGENGIYTALKQLKNQADWEKLKLSYASVYEANDAWYHLLSANLSSDLVASLQSELTTSELAQCRNILTARNINPGF